MNIIWIDVSRNTLDIYNASTKNHTSIDNNINQIISFFKSFKCKDYIILFETTWIYSNNLIKACNDLHLNYFIINPSLSHNLSSSLFNRNSNDKLDSKKITQIWQFLINSFGEIPPTLSKPISNEILKLKNIHRAILNIKKQVKILKNYLEVEKHDPFVEEDIICYYEGLIQKHNEKIKELENRLINLIDKMWYKKHLENIKTIPWIGKKTAIELVLIFLELKDRWFTKSSIKKVKAYLWIEPNEKKSGTSVNRIKISRKWRWYLRSMLFMNCLLWFKLVDKEKYKDTNMWRFFKRMREKFWDEWWKRWYSTITAMMNKIVQVAWWIFWNNQSFDYNV